MFRFFVFITLLLCGVSTAQRPSNQTICDYYTVQRYGANTTDAQNKLMQSIISLAFGGGAAVPNATDITGIFNLGNYKGTPVDLRPFFNGTVSSTNLNNAAAAVNWLDGGGVAPLSTFLAKDQAAIQFATNTTNQYRLFSHWTFAFSKLFGCTQPAPIAASPFLSAAYVHKFMDLNFTQIGHFINQFTQAASHFGFSDQDALTLNTQMNAVYNIRCAPPVTTNPKLGPQLYSICQDESCPLAQPAADCDSYKDIQPSLSVKAASSTTSGVPSSTASSSTSTTTPTTSPTSSPTAASSASSSLSPGGIAGAAIGGAAVFIAGISLIIWLFRRGNNKPHDPYKLAPASQSYYSASHPDTNAPTHQSYMSGATSQTAANIEQWRSEAPTGAPPVEMEGGGGNWPGMSPMSPKQERESYLSSNVMVVSPAR